MMKLDKQIAMEIDEFVLHGGDIDMDSLVNIIEPLTAQLEASNTELLEALEDYINVPVMADPGHELELISAIDNAQTTIRRARDG